MADIIDWSNIVGNKTLNDGGFVGDLMSVARLHINDAKAKGELTAQEAGEVYAAMIPSAFKEAINFELNEKLAEASVAKAEADAITAKVTADREYVLTLASVDKVYGFSYTLGGDGYIDKGSLADTSDGQMDYESAEVQAKTVREDKRVSLSRIPSTLK